MNKNKLHFKQGSNDLNGRVLLITASSGLGFNLAPHFGVYQLYNYLINKGIACDLYDRDLEQNNWTEKGEEYFTERIGKGLYDIIGISVSHDKVLGEQKMVEDLDIIWRLRSVAKACENEPIFVAGGQAAALNHELWLDLGIDVVFLGFAEASLYEFCNRLNSERKLGKIGKHFSDIAERIPGLAYNNLEGKTIYVPSLPIDQDSFRELFFEFPMSYDMPYHEFWDLLRSRSANQQLGGSKFVFENVRIYSTSHCPRRCGFCNSQSFLTESILEENELMATNDDYESVIFSKGKMKIFQLSAQELGSLILHYTEKYGAKSFLFSDDDFLVGSKQGVNRVRDFCNLMLQYKALGKIDKDVRFSCQTRVACFLKRKKEVDKELIQLMVDAGWLSCSLGVETFSDSMLKAPSVNKIGITSQDCRNVIDVMLEIGMVPQINIILGIPEYSPEELIETVEIAIDYVIKGCDISVSRQLLALPGAPMYNGSNYKLSTISWEHPITGEEIKIPDYFIPLDSKVAFALKNFDKAAQQELDRIVKKMSWEGLTPPKRVIAICALMSLPRLLNIPHLTAKIEKKVDWALNGILKGNFRDQESFVSEETKAVSGSGDLEILVP